MDMPITLVKTAIITHFLHVLKVSCCAPKIFNLSMCQLKSKNHIQIKIKEYCTHIQTITGIDFVREL